MASLLLILKLFGGLILLFLLGRTIGHLFKLDEFYKDIHKYQNIRIKRCENEDDQNYAN
jgi:HAMP domain-containing protein